MGCSGQKKRISAWLCGLLAAAMLGGCMNVTPDKKQTVAPSSVHQGHPVILRSGDHTLTEKITVHEDGKYVWVPFGPVMRAMGMQVRQSSNGQTARAGQTDVQYELRLNEARAFVAGSPVQLPAPPKRIGQTMHLTVTALETLTGTTFRYDPQRKQLMIKPVNDLTSGIRQMNLAEGPQGMKLLQMLGEQPVPVPRNDRTGDGGMDGPIGPLATGAPAKPAVTPAPAARGAFLVRKANSFLGTPYEFGAKPFPVSGKFDCSSFVQYVYSTAGVSLPRASRIQAQVGKEIATDQLKSGDLLFFYTPGRFASNKIVGHVGMYAGNGTFIHTYGKPGVTRNRVDDPKWSYRLLFAKRIP